LLAHRVPLTTRLPYSIARSRRHTTRWCATACVLIIWLDARSLPEARVLRAASLDDHPEAQTIRSAQLLRVTPRPNSVCRYAPWAYVVVKADGAIQALGCPFALRQCHNHLHPFPRRAPVTGLTLSTCLLCSYRCPAGRHDLIPVRPAFSLLVVIPGLA
jgi:hypothetical protein